MVERFKTGSSDQGRRLDVFVSDMSSSVSRTQARKIIDIGGVHIDGRRVRKAGLILEPDQQIELYRDDAPLDPYRIEPDQILFQDEYIIVINKPSGVETQPTPARYKGTLYEALQVLLKRDRRFGRRLEIGMAQRLDRDTSGVIIFSIHPSAHKSLTAQMQLRSVKKIYEGLVAGRPKRESGTYRSHLLRDRRTGIMRSVAMGGGGKEAITNFRVSETQTYPIEISLIELELITGRTHQIRAHLSEAGYPLLGDIRYGGSPALGGCRFTRHCLHSSRLDVMHPHSKKHMQFTAPLPGDMDMKRLFKR